MNPPASKFPAACRGVSEQKVWFVPLSRIEYSPQLAAESFNSVLPSTKTGYGREKTAVLQQAFTGTLRRMYQG
jgi:hypothetical protein